MEELPHRKRPDHGIQVTPSGPTIVFVTACTKNRRPLLARPDFHDALVRVWGGATDWLVGRYVIMADHVHFFVAPGERDISLEVWGRYWKRVLGQEIASDPPKWQAGHWDTRMRTSKIYQEKWEYVLHNPVRHGLVDDIEDRPFKGEIHSLGW